MTSRLTMSYGVRWEPFIPEQRPNHTAYTFDLDKFNAGIKSTVYLNAPAGFQYYGDPGSPNGTAGVNKTWAQFSPRLGLAWDVTGTANVDSCLVRVQLRCNRCIYERKQWIALGGAACHHLSDRRFRQSPARCSRWQPFPLNHSNFIFRRSRAQTQPLVAMLRTESGTSASKSFRMKRRPVRVPPQSHNAVAEQAPPIRRLHPRRSMRSPDGKPTTHVRPRTTDLRRRFTPQYADGKYRDCSRFESGQHTKLQRSTQYQNLSHQNTTSMNYTWSHVGDPVNGFTSAGI
jgi:hypothetical protein